MKEDLQIKMPVNGLLTSLHIFFFIVTTGFILFVQIISVEIANNLNAILEKWTKRTDSNEKYIETKKK